MITRELVAVVEDEFVSRAGDVLGFGSDEPAPPGGTLPRFVGDD